jgi:hypothetical protein
MSALSPEMLTLASIVSVKIQTCMTRYEDEGKKKKKCVRGPARACLGLPGHFVRSSAAL